MILSFQNLLHPLLHCRQALPTKERAYKVQALVSPFHHIIHAQLFPKLSRNSYAFTASFKAFPALNFGALEASIFIVSPV